MSYAVWWRLANEVNCIAWLFCVCVCSPISPSTLAMLVTYGLFIWSIDRLASQLTAGRSVCTMSVANSLLPRVLLWYACSRQWTHCHGAVYSAVDSWRIAIEQTIQPCIPVKAYKGDQMLTCILDHRPDFGSSYCMNASVILHHAYYAV